jgi:hypothetical protein
VSEKVRQELVDMVERLYDQLPARREVTAADFMMDDLPGEQVVVQEGELKWDGNRIRVGRSLPDARPPFEWSYEVSSDVGEADYFKHYLVLEKEIVLAQRKVLMPIDDEEAEVLRADLQAALAAVADES